MKKLKKRINRYYDCNGRQDNCCDKTFFGQLIGEINWFLMSEDGLLLKTHNLLQHTELDEENYFYEYRFIYSAI